MLTLPAAATLPAGIVTVIWLELRAVGVNATPPTITEAPERKFCPLIVIANAGAPARTKLGLMVEMATGATEKFTLPEIAFTFPEPGRLLTVIWAVPTEPSKVCGKEAEI
jgi:hypothetical protein